MTIANQCHIAYRFQHEQQLWVAEDDGGERDSKAEAEEEHHVGFIVKLVACCVPVWATGTLHALWDIPRKRNNYFPLWYVISPKRTIYIKVRANEL